MKQRQIDNVTRRDFLRQSACAAVGTTALASTVWDLRMVNAALAQSTPTDYKALVCIFMFGGNDSNNLIVPTDTATYNTYKTARASLALPNVGDGEGLLPLSAVVSDGHTYGIHPACPELQMLFDSGKLAVLSNVGTLIAPITREQYLAKSVAVPPQLFSHENQQVQWQTSIPDQRSHTGWGGRCADLLSVLNGSSTVSMSISIGGLNTFEIGEKVDQFNISASGKPPSLTGLTPPRKQVVKDILGLPMGNLYAKEFAQVTSNGITNNAIVRESLAAADAANPINTPFPASHLGNQCKTISRLINARNELGHKRQIFFAAVTGYDTHDDQPAKHSNLLSELSKSMKSLYDATMQMGVESSVTTFTASDFGRTGASNNKIGSDHGWGGHQLICGGAVSGKKLYGKYPTLAVAGPDDTDLGRWIPSTSVDEYAATLAKWFGVSNRDMSTVFPNLKRFAQPDLGFMNV